MSGFEDKIKQQAGNEAEKGEQELNDKLGLGGGGNSASTDDQSQNDQSQNQGQQGGQSQ